MGLDPLTSIGMLVAWGFVILFLVVLPAMAIYSVVHDKPDPTKSFPGETRDDQYK